MSDKIDSYNRIDTWAKAKLVRVDDDPLPERTAMSLKMLAQSKQEVCGFIFDDFSFAPVPNISARPQKNFEMDPGVMLEILQKYRSNIIGVYHSHPRGTLFPSISDLQGWPNLAGVRYFIVTIHTIVEWRREPIDNTTVTSASEPEEELARALP